LPYIYTAHYSGSLRGLIITRPMYYSHPFDDFAYNATGQYYFGDSLLVAPVIEPLRSSSATSNVRLWFPPQQMRWYSLDNPRESYVAPGLWVNLSYALSRTPVFVRDDAILTMLPDDQIGVGRASSTFYAAIDLVIYPRSTFTWMYEDDGTTSDDDKYCNTTIAVIRSQRFVEQHRVLSFAKFLTCFLLSCVDVNIQSTGPGYGAMPATRSYTLKMLHVFPSNSVTVNGMTVEECVGDNVQRCWRLYDVWCILALPPLSTQNLIRVSVC
jgi:hypothetical protein